MIRKYKPKDYEFVLNGLYLVQKTIKMEAIPFEGRGIKNKKITCEKFLKKIITPQNKCYIVEKDSQKIGFICYKPTESNCCFLEFFFKIPSVKMTPHLIKTFKNHINWVKTTYKYEKMLANIANRKEYARWLNISTSFLKPTRVSKTKENNHLFEF